MRTKSPETVGHCAYCGHPIGDDVPAPERFGERFCSAAHAEQFVAGVRAARIDAAASAATSEAPSPANAAGACSLSSPAQGGWSVFLKRATCWGAPLLVLIAIPLVWSGGWAVAGGSMLSVIGLLACPLGMYFMMRAIMPGRGRAQGEPPRESDAPDAGGRQEDRHA